MITIGTHLFGPEVEATAVAIEAHRLMRRFAALRSQDYNTNGNAWINPIIIIPGSLGEESFDGLKLGYFSKKKLGCVVMIAVPRSVISAADAKEFLSGALREAVALAGEKFKKSGIDFDKEEALALIEASQKDLSIN